MRTIPPTYDEHWHRVAPRRVRMRPCVDLFAQTFRGRRWYVVRDSLSGKFFRIRPVAYEFICELERCATVGDAWQRRMEIDPENFPGQGEVVRLLSSLYRAGLLSSDEEGDVEPLAEAFAEEKRVEARQRWSSILFFKLPLWNPDPFLRRTLPWVRGIFSYWGLLVWLLLLIWGATEVANHWKAFTAETSGILGFGNLPWMLITLALIKVLHEAGHGYLCRKYGGEVPETGIMLLLFNPLPYVDASSSSALRSRWKRMAVGGAGMYVELAVAAVAAIVWANSGEGAVHRVAHNAVVAASVVTVLFNANPLLRFDGYHILSDWLELPNLQRNSSKMALYLLEHHGFGLRNAVNPAEGRREATWFTTFFFSSVIYRTLILIGILLVISVHYLVFGVLLALVFGFIWLVMPVVKAVTYLWSSPRLDSCRRRAVGVSVAVLAVLLGFFALVPMPNHFRSDAVVKAENFSRVYTGTNGHLVKILAPSGQMVTKGTPLLQLANRELDYGLVAVQAERMRADAQLRRALEEDPVAYQSLQPYIRALEGRRARLLEDKQALVLRSPTDGRWLAPEAGLYLGGMLSRGLEVGVVQGEGNFYVSAVIKQDDVSRIFTKDQVHHAEVRVRGQEGTVLGLTDLQALPTERESLPSAALGLLGGGATAVDTRSPSQSSGGARRGFGNAGQATRAAQPVFEIRAALDRKDTDGLQLVHGQRAIARMKLPAEPLLWQWVRSIRQLFQRTYQI